MVALKPTDALSAKLVESLEAAERNKADAGAPGAPTPPPAPDAAIIDAKVPEGATVAGTWSAKPNPDTTISLVIEPGGAFTWKVTLKDKTQQFSGTSTFGGGLLTLAQEKGPVLVGRVSWTDLTHMTFRLVGGASDEPGLSFSK